MESTVPVPNTIVPPLALMLKGPLPVVVMFWLKANDVPERLMPATAVVLRAPLNVVVPLPASWAREAADIAWVLTVPA